MNRGGVNSRRRLVDSPPNHHQTPVQVDASSGGIVSSASGEKSHSSGKTVGHTSGGSVYHNETPAGHQGRRWFTGSSGSSSRGSSIYHNETAAGCQGRGWSTYGSGTSSRGGSTRQWTKSSKASNGSDFHRDELLGSNSREKDVNKQSSDTPKAWREGDSESSPTNLIGTFMECHVHHPDAAQLSGESMLPESSASIRENENSECRILKFDLCPPRKSNLVKLNPSLLSKNRERRKENARSVDGPKGEVLRPGMVLLKSYLSTSEQVSILNICRSHGRETVGFYQPEFGDGGKMHLKLMCFGMFWNPETNQYGNVRSDGVKPPPIPQKFLELVDRAIKDSRSLISEDPMVKNVEFVLPSVKPDICLVNYYSNTGRLGLHQDKDESQESLIKGIPIVSFSIGDSAEFLYSDKRDVENADQVTLESGDVLIFGGDSRNIFHGVPAIRKETAPKQLLAETNFRSGRLNLTFRQRF